MIYLLGNQPELHPNPNYISLTSSQFTEKLLDQAYSSNIIAVDTETEGFFDFENKVVMLQLGTSARDQYVIDARAGVPAGIISLLNDDKILKLLWNVKFDYKFLLKDYGIRLNNVYDGFIAELCLQCGLPRENQVLSLGDNSIRYLNKKLNKDVRNKFVGLEGRPFTTTQIKYGAEDVEVLFEIREQQLKLIQQYNIEEVVKLENDAVLALADMEYNGMPFNPYKWLELAKTASTDTLKYIEALDDYVLNTPSLRKYVINEQLSMFGYKSRIVNIDWDSPTKLVSVFNDAGMEVESVGKEAINKYKKTNKLAQIFSEYQIAKKRATTYGHDFLKYVNKKTHRIHTEFWPIIDTHRVSSANPNMQQIPSYKNQEGRYPYLECFECTPGNVLVSRDYSGQELRIIAEGSKDSLWVTAFNEGRDLHSEVAVLMFNIVMEEVKSHFVNGKSYRDVAKNINFGLAYGMSEYRLSDMMGISIEEARRLINNYFNSTKGLKEYFDKCIAYARQRGYIRSYKPYSAIRFLDKSGFNEGQIDRRAMNSPIQTTGAMMTKKALVMLREHINKNNLNNIVKLVLPVHDAIMSETTVKFSETWAEIKGNIMLKAGEIFIKSVPVKSDLTINTCWTK